MKPLILITLAAAFALGGCAAPYASVAEKHPQFRATRATADAKDSIKQKISAGMRAAM